MPNPKEVLDYLEEESKIDCMKKIEALERENKKLSEKLELALHLILKMGSLIP